MVDRSPIHGIFFGGSIPGRQDVWEGRFLHEPGRLYPWCFEFLDEWNNGVPELTAWGSTPREAFEEVVSRFVTMNNGVESETLAFILPFLRRVFNDQGGIKAEWILGQV